MKKVYNRLDRQTGRQADRHNCALFTFTTEYYNQTFTPSVMQRDFSLR